MHRVLSIPELLDIVFTYLDREFNANNASVCKQWCEVALTALWTDVDDLHRLISLLVPLKKKRDIYVSATYCQVSTRPLKIPGNGRVSIASRLETL